MRELTIKEAQKLVDDWINKFEEGYWPPLSILARVMEEVGELAREVNAVEGPKKRKESEKRGDIGMEIGDILFTLICMANYYGIDLEKAFKEVMKKYDERDVGRWVLKSNR